MPSATALSALAAWTDGYKDDHFGQRAAAVGLEADGVADAAPMDALRFAYQHYFFNRAVDAGYNELAVHAVDEVGQIDPDALWEAFVRRCEANGYGLNARVNRGAVEDTAALVADVGNPFAWVGEVVRREGSLDTAHERIAAIGGAGPKITQFFLRDAVWLADVEDLVPDGERHLLQPIDIWTRRAGECLLDDAAEMDDDDLAAALARECDRCDVSGIRVNQGAWYLGAKALDGDAERFTERLATLGNRDDPDATRQRARAQVEALLSDEGMSLESRIALESLAYDRGLYSEHEHGERLATFVRMRKGGANEP